LPVERAQYRRLVQALPDVTQADEALLETLAQALVLQRTAFAEILQEGLLVVDAAHGGDLRRNPALIAWRTASEVTRAALARLGGSPLDRQRLPEPADGPTLQDILYSDMEPAPAGRD
jgi:P27 family predicted phage terminase small subunit